MSDETAKESFWDAMQKSAEPARSSPTWMKAGINLSERNFTTFRAGTSQVQETAESNGPNEEK